MQWRLLGQGTPVESEVLKVHHHGVGDASEPGYLDAVKPRVAMLPIATYESYGGTLPSGVVLSRLRARVVDVYASDRAEPLDRPPAGSAGVHVTVATDGISYELHVQPSTSIHWPGDAAAIRRSP